MDQQKLESLLIDYIDGKLNSVDKHYVEQELLKNPKSYRLYEELKEVIQLMNKRQALEPSPSMKNAFDEMLLTEIRNSPRAKQITLNPVWYKVAAAAAFLVVGLTLGFWFSKYQQRQQEIAAAKAESVRVEKMVTMIRNEHSAGQRILGVKEATNEDQINQNLLRVLIQTLNEDPNINVRMAALAGLEKFYNNPQVRKALVESLSKQNDPVIQITLIKILVDMKEKSALQPLKNILENDEMIPAVRDEANMGILVLS